jgi:hypothetical protein
MQQFIKITFFNFVTFLPAVLAFEAVKLADGWFLGKTLRKMKTYH